MSVEVLLLLEKQFKAYVSKKNVYLKEENIIYSREGHFISYFEGIFKIPYLVLLFLAYCD